MNPPDLSFHNAREIEEASEYLKEGEFEKAKTIFSNLLDKEPENPDFISGFFISGYWDNRIELIFNSKEGKDRASRLVQLFDEFEKEVSQRNFSNKTFLSFVTECVLGEASSQFRKAYQREGMIGLEPNHLIQLVRCLMKIGDYTNAKEILEYSKNFHKSSGEIRFFEAECIYHLGDHRQSRVLYRDAMLLDPLAIRPEMVNSEPLHSAILSISKEYSEIDFKEYLPVYCLEKNIFTEVKNYSDVEIQNFIKEISRLEESFNSKIEKYSFKIRCRMIQLLVTILDSSFKKNLGVYEEAKHRLECIEPGFLERRNNANS
ncbi:MAG: hypothetical protein L6Q54_08180 [Leptospiraceae bacterium]|nr:hypothetical protein [Leptospiraceae bacterium]MCK6381212.1 hypothetical protein [Leptospiraceae bacterium]NUM42564.1 hypothetical protein [Leptospiraceae bacterium]